MICEGLIVLSSTTAIISAAAMCTTQAKKHSVRNPRRATGPYYPLRSPNFCLPPASSLPTARSQMLQLAAFTTQAELTTAASV